jgi:hypothetical protein
MNAPTKIAARDALRAAIDFRRHVAEAAARANDAAERARQLRSMADYQVTRRANLEAGSHALRVEAMKARALDGSSAQAATPGDAPPIEQQHERQRLVDEAAAARAAHEQLQADAQLRAEELRQADARVVAAADRVIAEQALPALGAYVRAIAEARQAWSDAQAIVRLLVPAAPSWAAEMHMPVPGLPDGVRAMLDRGFGTEPGPRDHGSPPARAAAWEDFRRRLRDDADAEI